MPNFSHARHKVLGILARNQAATLRNLMRTLGIGENNLPAEYLRVHQLMTRLLKAGLVSRSRNPRHGLTSYTITGQGRNTLVDLDKKIAQETKKQLARKKKESSETPDEAPVVVRPIAPLVPPSQDVVRCPQCNFLIPAMDVRHSLHATGTVTCPKCRCDLTEVIGGTPED